MQEQRRIVLCGWIDKHFDLMEAVEKEIWAHPETGYKEWRTHAYVKQQMEALGYRITEVGEIPGLMTEIDTGRPGPTVAVMAELDSIVNTSHPAHNPETQRHRTLSTQAAARCLFLFFPRGVYK